jgi:hypothetical protein
MTVLNWQYARHLFEFADIPAFVHPVFKRKVPLHG